MKNQFEKFNALHRGAGLFILPNAWDSKSAASFQENQFSAIATSSAAVANSLGYKDGEDMPFDDYLFVIKHILAIVQVPVSIDLEMGYGRSAEEIYKNISRLVESGVVGVNLEDSGINDGVRLLKPAEEFAKLIVDIKNRLVSKNIELFLNVRCDTFILDVGNKQQETNRRLKLYEASGADGIFLPCISKEEDIAEAVRTTKLPLNVMCIPGLPDFNILNKLGVKRVSTGPFLFNKIYNNIGGLTHTIMTDDNFSAILS